MILARSTEYAIRALVFIQVQNWRKKRPLISEIAREIEAPEAFTAKVLQALAKRGTVKSMKGRGGGFFFDEEAEEVSLYQVINTTEGDKLFHQCGFGLKNCSNNNPCPLHDRYQEVRDGFYAIVTEETIQSLSKKILEGKAVLNRIEL
ncbi:MAG: RrF2 family transcriptional regulator [Bacteroidota bacterium]